MTNFWHTLPRPFFALAPMANVTDAAFRRLIAKYGKPDVMWTEFVSCDGLLSAGREKLLVDLWYSEAERPIVAQIFGAVPEHFYQCAQLVASLGFDGIDINMGCPDRAVEKQGAGAALMKNPKLAKEIIAQTKRGADGLPVSIKTRMGYSKNELEAWLPHLLEAEPAAVTLHLRTRKEMSSVPAHWDAAAQAREIIERFGGASAASAGGRTLLIGNGDSATLADAQEKAQRYGVDGVMIGRGVFGSPFLFAGGEQKRPEERLRVMLEHTTLFEKLYGPNRTPDTIKQPWLKNFDVMKKHYQAYVSGWPGAKELRAQLMTAESAAETAAIVARRYPNIAP